MLATIFNENYNSYYDWQSYEINYELLKKRLISLKNDLGYSREFVDIMSKILKKDEHERYSVDQLDGKLRHKKSLRGRNSIGSLHLEQSPIPHRYNMGYEDESSLNFMGIEAVNGNKDFVQKSPGGQRPQLQAMQGAPMPNQFDDPHKTQPNSRHNINRGGYGQKPAPAPQGNFAQRRKSSPMMQGGQRYKSRGKSPQMQKGYNNNPRQQRQATQHQQTPNGKNKVKNGYGQNPYKYSDQKNWQNMTKNSQGSFQNPLRTTTGSNRNGALRGSGTSYPQQMMKNSRNGAMRGSNGSFGNKGVKMNSQNATIRGTKGSYGNATTMNNSRNGTLRGSQALRGSRNTVVPPLNNRQGNKMVSPLQLKLHRCLTTPSKAQAETPK